MNGLKLLLIVDNATLVDEVVARFRNESVTISWKVDCRGLMEWIGYVLPDIVILDTNMSGTSPTTVSSRIRSQYPLIKLIVLSEPDAFQKAISKILQDGVDYIKKPIAIDEIVKKIRKIHKNKRNG